MEFLLDHTNFFERFFDWLFLCQNFWAGLFFCHANAKLPPKHWTSVVIENMSHACAFKSTCSSAKWHSPVITNHLSVASRFPLCRQYTITKFIYLPLVVDFIRRQRSRNCCRVLSPYLKNRIHMHYRNFNFCTLTIKTLLIQSYSTIFSLFRYTVFRLKVKCRVTHSTSYIDD